MLDLASMRLFRPLKHPQVNKLTPQHRTQHPFNPTMTAVLPQPRESTVPRAEAYSDTRLPPQLVLPPVMPLLPAAKGYVIPHDEAYASAKRHDRPTLPSPETLSPAPVSHAARMGAYQGCASSMSIVVQKLDAEFAGAVPWVQVKVSGKGHGRGKVCDPPLRL